MSKQSRETFFEQLRNGAYESKQKQVYEHVWEHGPVTLADMRAATGMAHQTLTSRLSSLQDLGVIFQDAEGRFDTAPSKHYDWYANQRKKLRYERWKKRGEDEDFFTQWSLDRICRP